MEAQEMMHAAQATLAALQFPQNPRERTGTTNFALNSAADLFLRSPSLGLRCLVLSIQSPN
jgi:hypothetical protein